MPNVYAKFKKELKNCESLEDYRRLAEEYDLEDEKTCSKYRDYIRRISIRKRKLFKIF